MSDKLKPCPLCFDRGVSIHQDHKGAVVFCTVCETAGPCRKCLKDAITDWNTLPRHLQWTTKTPTEEGWYWNRVAGKETIPVKLYYDSDGEYCYRVTGLPDDCWLVEDLADEVGCEWAGPISEPQEPK